MPVDHYENFPVASRLCPPRLRPAVVAIYHFARTADDLADEGEVSTESRLAALADYRADLERMLAGEATTPRWAPVFLALAKACHTHALPAAPLRDLLSAFEQDTGSPRYADRTELLDYCRRSANPIGRLLLHLYGVRDAEALKQSDDICTALQLINFWQDLSVDLPRRRVYLPDVERQAFAVADEAALDDAKRLAPLVAALCDWAEELMHQGAPLARRLPGRVGWELRFVVAGGLRILEKIRTMNHLTRQSRPTLGLRDAPALLWRALWMPRPATPSRPALR